MQAAITALLPIVVQVAVDLINGAKPEDVFPKLQAAALAYSAALSDWERAKRDNPA